MNFDFKQILKQCFILQFLLWVVYFEQSNLELLNFGTDHIYKISLADPTMVRVKGKENLYDFSPFRLAERKGSCRLSTAVKRQMGRSGVMACSSVTYENMKFHETGHATDPFQRFQQKREYRYGVKDVHKMIVWQTLFRLHEL